MNTNPVFQKKIKNRPQQYILLTGSTGLVGRYLLRDLFIEGRQIAVIARPAKRLTVEQRIETIMQMWEEQLGNALPRPVVFEGEVSEPGLGLKDEDLNWIKSNCSELIHNAAVLQFYGTGFESEPWRTNLAGTENVLKLAKQCDIRNLHYVSTAYVCGERIEEVSESDLECGQEFRNDYERSKFEAEKLVRAADCFDQKTIYRPAVIVGDSRTGYTSTYHGLYLYLRLLATLVPQQKKDENGVLLTPIQLPMSGDEPRNLVPVDWVSAVITHGVQTPAAQNRTFHLVPEECSTARDVIDACYEYFNSYGVEYCGANFDRGATNEFAQMFFDNARVYESYETSDPKFNNENVKKFMGHLPCPAIDKKAIIRFMKFGEADNWGKRKMPQPEVGRWFSNELDSVIAGARQISVDDFLISGERSLSIGLDIHGPGGGQWKLTASNESCEISQGLPVTEHHLVKMNDVDVSQLVNGNGNCTASAWARKFQSVLASKKS